MVDTALIDAEGTLHKLDIVCTSSSLARLLIIFAISMSRVSAEIAVADAWHPLTNSFLLLLVFMLVNSENFAHLIALPVLAANIRN